MAGRDQRRKVGGATVLRPPPLAPHKARILAILDGHDPAVGRTVAFAVQGLIVLSAISLSIETLPGLAPEWQTVFAVEEIVILTVFTAEFALRLYAAPSRWRYLASPYGIVDMLAVVPAILFLGSDTRAVRALRLLRLFSLFKLARYVHAFERLGRAFTSVLSELLIFIAIACVVLYLCSAAIYFFEHEAQPETFASIPHAMWWAVVTLTTVGYGDMYPVTAGGRIFTGLMLICALGIIAVPTGLVSSALSQDRQRNLRRDAAEPPQRGRPRLD